MEKGYLPVFLESWPWVFVVVIVVVFPEDTIDFHCRFPYDEWQTVGMNIRSVEAGLILGKSLCILFPQRLEFNASFLGEKEMPKGTAIMPQVAALG